ncbi:MAG: hypothetical protein ACYCZ7_00275, partial [Minisyncoccota bacterium]
PPARIDQASRPASVPEPRPALSPKPLLREEPLRPRVEEKPFAKAFQELEKVPAQEPLGKISLATLAQAKPERGTVPQRQNKGPRPESLSSLKSALAGALKEHEEKRAESVPKEVPQEKPLEPVQKPAPIQKSETPRPAVPKEVPEDVLSAILRGED